MRVMHLTSSRFFGGPERQMLGLAVAGREKFETVFASISEQHLCRAFLQRVADQGFVGIELTSDTPHLFRAVREICGLLRQHTIDVLLCHGYKAGLLGWWSARRVGIPVLAVSRGWTGENRKVRFYEAIDTRVLRWMDRVICVSQAQAEKVKRCGVRPEKIVVIPNAIDTQRFAQVDPAGRQQLEQFFPIPVTQIVGAAGRLSPEKGFDLLIAAAAEVVRLHPQVGFILFGEGPLQIELLTLIRRHGLETKFVLAGFCNNLDQLLPFLDLFVQSSRTEGMPNVILEALAAGVTVVATNVGGTSEILDNGIHGKMVAPNSVSELASALTHTIRNPLLSNDYSIKGKAFVAGKFGFSAQAFTYSQLLEKL